MAAIQRDPNFELIVDEIDRQLVGMLQLTCMPSLTHSGTWRNQVEGVRVVRHLRRQGGGRVLLRWAATRARARGCRLVQQTMDRQ